MAATRRFRVYAEWKGYGWATVAANSASEACEKAQKLPLDRFQGADTDFVVGNAAEQPKKAARRQS